MSNHHKQEILDPKQDITPQKYQKKHSGNKNFSKGEIKTENFKTISKTVKKNQSKIEDLIKTQSNEILSLQIKHSFTGHFAEI